MYSYAPKLNGIVIDVPESLQSRFPYNVASVRYPHIVACDGTQIELTNKEWAKVLTSEASA